MISLKDFGKTLNDFLSSVGMEALNEYLKTKVITMEY